jgi:hypothetical protein
MVNRFAGDGFVTITSDTALSDEQLVVEIKNALKVLGIGDIEIKMVKQSGHCIFVRDLDILRASRNRRIDLGK